MFAYGFVSEISFGEYAFRQKAKRGEEQGGDAAHEVRL